MISLAQIQDFTQTRSVIVESAQLFSESFKACWHELKSQCGKMRLSKEFICSSNSSNSFFKDLSELFIKKDIRVLSEKFHHLDSKKQNQIELDDILDAILQLSPTQLKNLSKFHGNIVQSNLNELPEEAFRDIIKHFDGQNDRPNDRVEAGHFIMLLSQYANETIRLKNIFEEHKPITLDRIDALLEIEKPSSLSQYQNEIDQSLLAIKKIESCFKDEDLPLIEIKVWSTKLSRQKRSLLKVLLNLDNTTSKGGRDRMQKALCAFKAWGEWKVLCRYDQQAENAIEDQEFAAVLNGVQEQLLEYSQRFMSMLEALDSILVKGISGISLYCQDLLNDLKEVFKSVSSQEGVSLNLKKMLQKIQNKINMLSQKLKNHLTFELDELKGLPELFQRRLIYLSYEVPRIMSRGHSKEIKNMALVVNFHYRLAKIQLDKKVHQNLTPVEKNDITKLVQSRTRKIIQNSSELVRLMTPQGH